MVVVEKRNETMWKEGADDCEGDESLDNAGQIGDKRTSNAGFRQDGNS